MSGTLSKASRLNLFVLRAPLTLTTLPNSPRVRDKLQERSIRIPEINRRAITPGTGPSDRSKFYPDTMSFEVVHSILDRANPFKAKVTAARRHRNSGQRVRLHSRTMQIELGIFEPISPTPFFRDQLDANDLTIKGV